MISSGEHSERGEEDGVAAATRAATRRGWGGVQEGLVFVFIPSLHGAEHARTACAMLAASGSLFASRHFWPRIDYTLGNRI